MKEITIYTDGACLGNPGAGGWCAILLYKSREKICSGGDAHTTNNRMELKAVIEGLNALKEPCAAEIISDSKYVTDAFNNNWIKSWQMKDWKKADKTPVQNRDLWEELLELCSRHNVKFSHIRGHQGHEYNERCDTKAREEAQIFKESLQNPKEDSSPF